MAKRITVELPNGDDGWIEFSKTCEDAVMSYLGEHTNSTMADAAEEVLGVNPWAATDGGTEE